MANTRVQRVSKRTDPSEKRTSTLKKGPFPFINKSIPVDRDESPPARIDNLIKFELSPAGTLEREGSPEVKTLSFMQPTISAKKKLLIKKELKKYAQSNL